MRYLLALTLCALPVVAAAHPHVWVDVWLRLETDAQNRITGIEVTWSYDDFFTLLVLEDMGLDPEADGELTEAELARLKGFDLVEWPEGFEGDIYLHAASGGVSMALPDPVSVRMEAGRIIAIHRRDIDPVPLDGLHIETFDPTYFVDYRLVGVTLPKSCVARIEAADEAEADRKVEELAGQQTEDIFESVDIGQFYADGAKISCAGS